MGNAIDESFEEFLESLKLAGVKIDNEQQLKERLAEAAQWRYAFRTMAANGKVIGISFHEAGNGCDFSQIEHALERFHFPSDTQDILAASLKAH